MKEWVGGTEEPDWILTREALELALERAYEGTEPQIVMLELLMNGEYEEDVMQDGEVWRFYTYGFETEDDLD